MNGRYSRASNTPFKWNSYTKIAAFKVRQNDHWLKWRCKCIVLITQVLVCPVVQLVTTFDVALLADACWHWFECAPLCCFRWKVVVSCKVMVNVEIIHATPMTHNTKSAYVYDYQKFTQFGKCLNLEFDSLTTTTILEIGLLQSKLWSSIKVNNSLFQYIVHVCFSTLRPTCCYTMLQSRYSKRDMSAFVEIRLFIPVYVMFLY